MSVILDALKQAEHERGLVETPTVASVHVEPFEARTRSFPWAMAVVLLVSATMGLWAWLGWYGRAGQVVPPAVQPVARKSDSTAEERRSKAAPSQDAERPVSPLRNSAARQRAETRDFRGAEAPTPPPTATLTLPRTRVPAKAQQEVQQPESAVSSLVPSTDVDISGNGNGGLGAGVVAPVEPRVSDANVLPPVASPNPVRSEPARVPDESPSRLREAMKKMTLNGVVYSDDPGYRKVYIGGRGYSQGDVIDGNVRVEEIHPEGVTLAHQEERAVLRIVGR